MSKTWNQSFYTYVWVFNTERGLSVCVRFPHNVGLIYDLGASEDFSPAKFINENIAPHLTAYPAGKKTYPIAQCILSHPHADHITEIEHALDGGDLRPHLLTCPNDKEPTEAVDFNRILNDDNKELIDKYRAGYEKRTPPLQTLQRGGGCPIPNVEYGFYYLQPSEVAKEHPNDDHEYGNGLSIVVYLRHGNQSILIPGDVTPEVMARILDGGPGVEMRYTYFSGGQKAIAEDLHSTTGDQPTLRTLLGERQLSVLVAPHHGLESCFSGELFEAMKDGKPIVNVISEKRHLSATDGKVDGRYQTENGARGLGVDIDGTSESRYSVSTRNGHHIAIRFRGTDADPSVFLRSDPANLLEV